MTPSSVYFRCALLWSSDSTALTDTTQQLLEYHSRLPTKLIGTEKELKIRVNRILLYWAYYWPTIGSFLLGALSIRHSDGIGLGLIINPENEKWQKSVHQAGFACALCDL